VSRLEQAASAWNRFWFDRDDGAALCLFRALIGGCLVLKLTGLTGLYRLTSLTPAFPRRGVFPIGDLLGGFTVPYAWLEWLPLPTPFWFARIEDALLVLAILVTLGLFTRIALFLLVPLFTYVFFSSQLNYYHHMFFLLCSLAILAFSRCEHRFSLDALRASVREREEGSVLPVRLLQVLVCAVYGFAFLAKCNAGWLDGSVIESLADTGALEQPLADQVIAVIGYRGIAWFTLLIEALLPVCLWIPRVRVAALVGGVSLHLGIDLLMNVNSFGYQMIVSYVLFFGGPARLGARYDDRPGRPGRSRQWTASSGAPGAVRQPEPGPV